MQLRGAKRFLLVVLCMTILRETYGWVDVQDPREDKSLYIIGIGIHDATGPAAGVNMMGYANPAQINKGIHMRLYARAFLLDDGTRRVVFVSVDCGMMAQLVKMKVLSRLQETYGSLYTYDNVILSGTHTHSGPAGFLQYLLFDITCLGFIDETFEAMVEGTYRSIVNAHENLKVGYVYVSSGELLDASINRSPAAYDNDPEDEKAQYEYNTDKLMTLLRFVDVDGNNLGMLNWFAVHPTSMNNTNPLISGDNKGYASQLFEEQMNPGSIPGEGPFVAAFAQSNCGDVSPNTNGPHCQDTGLPCDILTSTCGGRSQQCIASGPGKDMVESTKIIGEKQFQKAWELYNEVNATKLSGPIQFSSQFIDMGNYTVTLSDGTEGELPNDVCLLIESDALQDAFLYTLQSRVKTTCEPALGYSFAAGTTDGPGAFDFTQGMTEENPFWNMVVNAIVPTRPEQEICQDPKPVLLDTGNYNRPYPWHPRIVETQIGRVGQLLILAVPGEFTTMSGRRIRNEVAQTAKSNGLPDPIPVLAGLSNGYTHYIATYEEYAIQRYEGASTIYGPHTLEAYIQQYSYLLDALAKGEAISRGPLPPNLYDEEITLLPGILFDAAEFGKKFGQVVAQPYPLAYLGETQIAIFVAGHPRNNVRLGKTFLTVERKINESYWKIVATDANWQTRFSWDRTSTLLGTSEATVYWDIPLDTPEGTYRIKHFGNQKSFFTSQIEEYEGVTEQFEVVSSPARTTSSYKGPLFADPFSWFRRLFG